MEVDEVGDGFTGGGEGVHGDFALVDAVLLLPCPGLGLFLETKRATDSMAVSAYLDTQAARRKTVERRHDEAPEPVCTSDICSLCTCARGGWRAQFVHNVAEVFWGKVHKSACTFALYLRILQEKPCNIKCIDSVSPP